MIGSIRRECVDHIVVFGERHLRHVLLLYMNYYNGTRTHLDHPLCLECSYETKPARVVPRRHAQVSRPGTPRTQHVSIMHFDFIR
ncbi:hypothetical protein [Nitrobacter sp.]|uniref:hypothetical protein n=1 Tax=unclassified Nitrobacter TaxID=2620411 RepID=UPI003448E544